MPLARQCVARYTREVWTLLPAWRRVEIESFAPWERENVRSFGTFFPEPPSDDSSDDSSDTFDAPTLGHASDEEIDWARHMIELRRLAPIRMNERYIRVPPDWTDEELRFAGEQIRSRRARPPVDTGTLKNSGIDWVSFAQRGDIKSVPIKNVY